ncbi:MAG: hypothetical protein JOZ72_02525 [Alphaproteobacteria bacterium]|nr:hypothetical protein [Alphaproteobacteria bacterium]
MSAPWRVLLAGGDGYCPFYGTKLALRQTTRPWFAGPGWDTALLFEVESGEFAGTLFALTSRWTTPLQTQLEGGGAAMVVHHIKSPDELSGLKDSDSCGMSFVSVLPDDERSRC